MKKKTTNKPAPQAKDAHYWQISIALSAINVLIMLYQINRKQSFCAPTSK